MPITGLNKRKIFLKYVWKLIGTWYVYGGDDPSGLDCSGLAVEALQSVGIIPDKSDYTADGLWRKFQNQTVSKPVPGCLVFYGTSDRASHVEIYLGDGVNIGASGGGANIKTAEDAKGANAFIKPRPTQRMKNILGYIDPFK